VTPHPGFKVIVYVEVENISKRCVIGTKLLRRRDAIGERTRTTDNKLT